MANAYLQGAPIRPLVCVEFPTDLRPAEPSALFVPWMLAFVWNVKDFFVWHATSLDADDGATVIKPNDLGAGDPGRWKRLGSGGTMAVETYLFRLDGPYAGAIIPGTFDGPMLVISARTIANVWLLRRRSGGAGTTRIAVAINGANLFPLPANEPQVTAVMGDYAVASSNTFVPGMATLAPGDAVEVYLQESETDVPPNTPEGLCVVIEFAP